MATEKDLRVYGLLKLPTQIIKDAILFIKGVNDTKVTAYVTDENGTPYPLKSGEVDTEVIPTLISGQSGNSLTISLEDDKLYVPPPEPSVTNLDTIPSPTDIEISNDNGDGFTLELADNTNAGLFSPAEKSKLASITEIFTTALKTAYDGAVTWIATNGANILNHLSNTSNPHNTTAAQVGAPSGSGTSTGSNTGDETTTTILNKIGDGSKISSSYLPAYVDDVLEFANFAALPVTGEQGIIYVTEDTNYSYRWSGSAYISLSNPLDYASQIEAEGNSENTKLMTSLRVFQNWLKNVTDYVHVSLPTTSKTILGAISELFTNKLDKNVTITGATKTKITYDNKGLVTSGADATTADIADSVNKRYQTDNQNTFNDATSSIQTQLNNLGVAQGTITTSVSITTATATDAGNTQNGRNILIKNSANAINLTCNGGVTATYQKGVGSTGAITFVQGSGRTLVQVSATAVLNGAVGSIASLTSDGTTDFLTITNF